MNSEVLAKLRELIQAEVIAGIYGHEPDESGYSGNNHAARKEADRIFAELLTLIDK